MLGESLEYQTLYIGATLRLKLEIHGGIIAQAVILDYKLSTAHVFAAVDDSLDIYIC